MIKDISRTWSGKAALVKRKDDFVVVHTYTEAYNTYTEVLPADERGIAKNNIPIEFHSFDVFDKVCNRLEYRPRAKAVVEAPHAENYKSKKLKSKKTDFVKSFSSGSED